MINYKKLWMSSLYDANELELRSTFRKAAKKLNTDELKQLADDVVDNYFTYKRYICDVLEQEIKAVEMNKKLEDINFDFSKDGSQYVVVIYDIENDDSNEEDKLAFVDCEDINKIYDFAKSNDSEVVIQKMVLEIAEKVE